MKDISKGWVQEDVKNVHQVRDVLYSDIKKKDHQGSFNEGNTTKINEANGSQTKNESKY